MNLEAETARLRAENTLLRQQRAEAHAHLDGLHEQLTELEQRITRLEDQPGAPPPWVKANRPKATTPKAPRKKRAANQKSEWGTQTRDPNADGAARTGAVSNLPLSVARRERGATAASD